MAERNRNYAGSDWIKANFKVEMSLLGEVVADLLGDLFLGIYHLDPKVLRKVDWANDHHIILALGWRSLATYDNDELTRLVILCHDRAIRCEISARNYKYLELMFHRRKRGRALYERHPTIEEAVEKIRLLYQPKEASL
jgi:hypothetical protein